MMGKFGQIGLRAAMVVACVSVALTVSALAQGSGSALPHIDKSGVNMQPAYPPVAMANGEQGSVVVEALVDPDGTVDRMRFAQSSGYDDLDNAAVAAVMGWRFIPAADGAPEWANVKIDFKLPNGAPESAPPAH